MSRLVLLIVVSFFILIASSPAYAHTQPGPPYLLINGQYADTNTLVSSVIILPQDLSRQVLLVGKPVEFKVDLSQIQLPPTTLQSMKWRWRWDLTDPSFEEGVGVKHIFNKTGSYIVTLQVLDPVNYPTRGFQDFDLVQVNIVPHAPYNLPTGEISAAVNKTDNLIKVSFNAVTLADSSSTIKEVVWDFSDMKTGSGTAITHAFQPFANYVFPLMRVIDSNGLFTDSALRISQGGSIENLGSTYPSSRSAQIKPSTKFDWINLLIPLFLLGLLLVSALSIKIFKNRKVS